ncbi:MAG: LysM peptidoglycan-binding domain-containing protein [bacterium]
MKRFFYTIVLMALMVIFMDPAANLLSRFLKLDQPMTHEIQEGEWLSKLAKDYYGDVSYWKELALINRAPNGNLIYPGEKIIIPSFDAIQKIRKTRRLSDVNDLVDVQQDILAGRIEHHIEPVAELVERKDRDSAVQLETADQSYDQSAAETELEEPFLSDSEEGVASSNGSASEARLSTPILTGLVVLGLIIAVGIIMLVLKRKRAEEVTFYGDAPEDEESNEDGESKEKSIYFFEDVQEEENKNGSKKEDRKLAEFAN